MTHTATLLLHVDDGRALPVQIHKEMAVRSPHTGRDLQELHGWVVTSDAQLHQRLATILPGVAERPMRSEDDAGEFTGRWCVSWNSYGEAAGVRTYTLILREAEELSLRALLLDELEVDENESSRAALAFYANYLERLAEMLVRKELLSREELRALREAARSEPGVTRHELWRVADVDQA